MEKQILIKLDEELVKDFKKLIKTQGHNMTSWIRTTIIKEIKNQS